MGFCGYTSGFHPRVCDHTASPSTAPYVPGNTIPISSKIGDRFLPPSEGIDLPTRNMYDSHKKYSWTKQVVADNYSTFVAGVVGLLNLNLDHGDFSLRDGWTIDQDKILTHEQKGK